MTPESLLMRDRLLEIIGRFPQRRVLVIGDCLADQFVHGTISRVSREAPVFILRHEQTETVPGGAANCAMNFASLGADPMLISVIGDDESGKGVVQRLKDRGVNCEGVIVSNKLRTVTKVRVLAGQVHSTRQQVIRIDYESDPLGDADLQTDIATNVTELAAPCDAVVISDYNYGVVSEGVAAAIRSFTTRKATPVFVDSRFRLTSFAGFTSATPNEDEVEHLLGHAVAGGSQLAEAAEGLRRQLRFQALLVTRGSHGMMLLQEGVPPLNLSAVGATEAVDVTGAGDTVIATYALAVACDASFADAARLANYAGGLVVMKRGTASVTADELRDSVLRSDFS